MSGNDNEDDKVRKGPITVLDLAMYRGAKECEGGGVTGGAIESVGLPFLGGCKRCGATIAAYNACPSKHGVLMCSSGCIGEDGYATVEEANRAIFPEEYEWQGVGHVAKDTVRCDEESGECTKGDDNG